MTAPVAGVSTAVRDGVATVVISNPARRNALSVSIMRELAFVMGELDADTGVRAVVLRGAGADAFASGADITEFEQQCADAEARRLADEAAADLFRQLSDVSVPLIAQIHGFCLGAGVAVALCADLRFADSRAVLAIPAARLGLGYPPSQTAALVQTVGTSAASDLLFTGRRLDAAEALLIGLVDRVVEPGDLGGTVEATARAIAANAPLSVRAAKAAVRAARTLAELGSARQAALAGERAAQAVSRCRTSRDLQEGTRAFLEKRPAVFRGE
ncbi:enoyl-CoA hydratase-related protein [Streptomyces sp. NPDC048002]|uniref:enoyl-CoA hydratase-related protein n=1 Tax=Streptomyces sp. NPDC048002 TaxID=3154344 RepID=UPI0033D45DBC